MCIFTYMYYFQIWKAAFFNLMQNDWFQDYLDGA